MNRSALIKALGRQQGISSTASAKVVDIFFGQMAATMANGGSVQIRGLCSFKVRDYPGYTGRNPSSGAAVRVRSKKLPFFRAGTELKNRVNRMPATRE